MERTRLSKREKAVLRTLEMSDFTHLSDFDKYAVAHLHDLGLLQAAFEEGHVPIDAALTTYGKEYLRANPHLHNPIRWNVITAIASTITALVAILALIIACTRL